MFLDFPSEASDLLARDRRPETRRITTADLLKGARASLICPMEVREGCQAAEPAAAGRRGRFSGDSGDLARRNTGGSVEGLSLRGAGSTGVEA